MPDSLQLSSSLAVLRLLHSCCTQLEITYGDKSRAHSFYLSGVQGQVCRPWSTSKRDYTFLEAKLDEMRGLLKARFATTTLEELKRIAMEIFNRYDNRRRCGVELLLLSVLWHDRTAELELPSKFNTNAFVMDMLVSCRQRHLKPEHTHFWSRQSETLLSSSFKRCASHLTRICLPAAGDSLLRAVSIYCRGLVDLEIQLSPDLTDDGLMALAGRTRNERDIATAGDGPNALSREHGHFGDKGEWFIKDCFIFTRLPRRPVEISPPYRRSQTSAASFPPSCFVESMPPMAGTGFGCLRLRRLRLNGTYVFPPKEHSLAQASGAGMPATFVGGPVLESGLYAVLTLLPELRSATVAELPLLLLCAETARKTRDVFGVEVPSGKPLRLDKVSFHDIKIHAEDTPLLDRAVSQTTHLSGLRPKRRLSDAHGTIDELFEPRTCDFLRSARQLEGLRAITARLTLPCLNAFLGSEQLYGKRLTRLNLHTAVQRLEDLVRMRSLLPNLETLEGYFTVCGEPIRPLPAYLSPRRGEYLRHMDAHRSEQAAHAQWDSLSLVGSDFSPEIAASLEPVTLPKLWKIDIEGHLDPRMLQVLVGFCPALRELHVTNTPSHALPGGGVLLEAKAWSDDHLEALLHVNPLPELRNLTLRMRKGQPADFGWFSERGLTRLLDNCAENSPHVETIVGEFTRVPDKTLEAKVTHYVVKHNLRNLRVRNAVPYRPFDNPVEEERFYGMNEGYRELVASDRRPREPEGAVLFQPPPPASREGRRRKPPRFAGYVFRPFEEDEEEEV